MVRRRVWVWGWVWVWVWDGPAPGCDSVGGGDRAEEGSVASAAAVLAERSAAAFAAAFAAASAADAAADAFAAAFSASSAANRARMNSAKASTWRICRASSRQRSRVGGGDGGDAGEEVFARFERRSPS